ncbi:hypothetical protein [Streptomyces sp. NPDC088733]|uniref:hypothetical protein n=1 Tax=Streptomyces sp. NPDC088733 TaxID=3365880 RepID=UPI003808269A
MPPMLDVSDEVRAEIGDEEAARLLAGDSAPGTYDCTSCRTPGDTSTERTSTVLFVGEETAVLAFAHATCIPSQVVPVSEEQLQGAVESISGSQAPGPAGAAPRQAVLGITCGLILIKDQVCPALVIEPTGPIARPGENSPGGPGGFGDDFLPILMEQGFVPVGDLTTPPAPLPGWSVLLAMGQLHAILQPGTAGAWWQAHQPLAVSEGWRAAVNKSNEVYVYAAPHGTIGQQPREDLLREALERACGRGVLVAATMPLSGT